MIAGVVGLVGWPGERTPPVTVDAIDGPAMVSAGAQVAVRLRASSGSGRAELTAMAGVATLRLDVTIVDGRGRLELPSSLTATAGRLTLLVGSAQHDIDVVPGPAVDPIVLAGPRTIVADALDRTLAVTAPSDRFGNAVADGTSVIVTRTDPSGQRTSLAVPTVAGLAWQPFTSGTVAGASAVWVETNGQASAAAVVDEVPGSAVSLVALVPDVLPAADGRSVVTFETEPVLDAHGNVLPDGVAGSFVAATGSGRVDLPAVIQNGRLRARWVVPAEPGVVTIGAVVNGVTSEPVRRVIDAALTELTVRTVDGSVGTEVEIGPLVGVDGALLADGTSVSVNQLTVALRGGRAVVTLVDRPRTVTVAALGVTTTVAVSR